MARSASGQTVTITVNSKDGTVNVLTAQAVGPNCILKFVMTGGGTWKSPYITFDKGGGTVFGNPVLNGNTVTVTDVNNDNVKYSYTIFYNAPKDATPKLLAIDPDIQNSNLN